MYCKLSYRELARLPSYFQPIGQQGHKLSPEIVVQTFGKPSEAARVASPRVTARGQFCATGGRAVFVLLIPPTIVDVSMTKWWDHAARRRGLRQPTARRAVDGARRAHEEPPPLLDEAAEVSGDHEFVFPSAKQIGIPIRRHSMSQVNGVRSQTSPHQRIDAAMQAAAVYADHIREMEIEGWAWSSIDAKRPPSSPQASFL